MIKMLSYPQKANSFETSILARKVGERSLARQAREEKGSVGERKKLLIIVPSSAIVVKLSSKN
jgi:hypothetical protein